MLFFIFLSLAVQANAGIEEQRFDNVEQQKQYKKLVDELRCLVCQNQNLADSNAELAQDLRKKVAEMISSGKTEEEIIDYMVIRYGDFVLYRPPFDARTFMLWTGPFIILLLGVIILIVFIRRQKNTQTTEISEEQRSRSKQLLDEDKGEK